MMKALDRLKSLLDSSAAPALARPWAIEQNLDKHIQHLEQTINKGPGHSVPRAFLEDAVRRFWTTKQLDNFMEALLVSLGIALPVGLQRVRVIEDKERFVILLANVDEYLPAPRQYQWCYQGLLSGYFQYDPMNEDTPPSGRENWRNLRDYLGKRSTRILDGKNNPLWVHTLQQHPTLFSENPCNRYGAALLVGDHHEVDELRKVLNIYDSTWFMRELFLGQVKVAVQKSDPEFLELLQPVIFLLEQNEQIRDDGLALVLDRFVRINPPRLSPQLRDAAVERWGNPWLPSKTMCWSRVTPDARAMVAEWLKLEFIEAFFTLLVEEKSGDSRRLEFWRRYVNSINDIHFALGAEARNSKDPDFILLRKKMEGLVVELTGNVKVEQCFHYEHGIAGHR